MYFVYYDESGDDGFPKYSSPIFVLTALYLHSSKWKETYEEIHKFREELKRDYGLPVKLEFHTSNFLLNKRPYRQFNIADYDRVVIIDRFCDLISRLDIKIVNVVINKQKITDTNYDVLDRALTYSIQRIENDLTKIDPSHRFTIYTDEGRVGKMRETARKIQSRNYIPSLFSYEPYRRDIKLLVGDIIPEDSKESYFIQMSDLVACIVYFRYIIHPVKGVSLHNRMPQEVHLPKILDWMRRLEKSLNVAASRSDHFGVVCYPK